MNKQKLNIRVEVADKLYRLQVNPEDEEFVRLATSHIKQKIQGLKAEYTAVEKQDYLAMVCLLICVDLLKQTKEVEERNQQLTVKLNQLDSILSDFLEEKEKS